MNIEPLNWSVVIAGYWNQAILTPAGIAYRLFKKPEGTPIQVEIPLDGIAPYRVRDGSIVVMGQQKKLLISTEPPSYENLQRALEIADIALKELPETPVYAAGVNILYKIEDISEIILKYMTSEIDEALSDKSYQIVTRILRRSINWRQGKLNLEITYDEQSLGGISLNFERQSKKINDLIEWVNTPIEKIKSTTQEILEKVLMLPTEEVNNEQPDRT